MAELQRALVKRACDWLKPGGTLIYAVCSLEREEGEDQAAWIAAETSLSALPITDHDLPEGLNPNAKGHLRTHPGMLQEQGGLDGFFISRWRK